MRKPVLFTSMLGAFFMALAYDQIEKVSGIEISLLLYAAVITMVVGLYTGLYTNNKQESKEEL